MFKQEQGTPDKGLVQMWITTHTTEINEGREIVLDENGRTDEEATLYRYGSQHDRLAWANLMISAAQHIYKDAVEYRANYERGNVVGVGDIYNALVKNARNLATKALWMSQADVNNESADHTIAVTVLNGNGREVVLTVEGIDGASGDWYDIKGSEYISLDITGFQLLD